MGDAFITARGGGAGLNLKVVGNPQPATASENTIWVDTDAIISGWVFSAPQPELPSEGLVWFPTGNTCNTPLNVLKRNSLWIYPIDCYQYVEGSWNIKKAQIYQNGLWRAVRLPHVYFFNNGDLGESGGFQTTAGTLTIDGAIQLSISSGTPAYVTANNEIDLTSFSTITFIAKGGGTTTSNFYVGVGATRDAFVVEEKANYTDYTEVTIDVSGLVGMHYVGFRNASWSTANTSISYVSSILIS